MSHHADHSSHVAAQVDAWVCDLALICEQLDNLLPANPRRLHMEDRRDELSRKIDAALGPTTGLSHHYDDEVGIDDDPFALPAQPEWAGERAA